MITMPSLYVHRLLIEASLFPSKHFRKFKTKYTIVWHDSLACTQEFVHKTSHEFIFKINLGDFIKHTTSTYL